MFIKRRMNPVYTIPVIGGSKAKRHTLLYGLLYGIHGIVERCDWSVEWISPSGRKYLNHPSLDFGQGMEPILLELYHKISNRYITLALYDVEEEYCISVELLDVYADFMRQSQGAILLVDAKEEEREKLETLLDQLHMMWCERSVYKKSDILLAICTTIEKWEDEEMNLPIKNYIETQYDDYGYFTEAKEVVAWLLSKIG